MMFAMVFVLGLCCGFLLFGFCATWDKWSPMPEPSEFDFWDIYDRHIAEAEKRNLL